MLAIGLTACGGNTNASQEAKADPPATESKAATATVTEYADNGNITPQKLPIVMDFNATWCGPCRQFGPVFHSVAEEYKGRAQFISIDVDKNPATAQQYRVSSIPQVTILMPDGTSETTIGSMDAQQFKQFLSKAIK